MEEKKFYGAGMLLGVISFIVVMFEPMVGGVLGIVSLYMNVKNKERYRVKIGVACAIISLLCSIAFLAWMIWIGLTMPNGGTDYWFFKLIFGKHM